MLIDGVAKTFQKEQPEKISRDGKYSYPNKYWIDGYDMPEGEYKKALDQIVPERLVKVLTDLHYFNDDKKLSRRDRRAFLVEMGGTGESSVY